MKNRSSPDDLSDSLYRVFNVTDKAYMETLLKNESPHGLSNSLY